MRKCSNLKAAMPAGMQNNVSKVYGLTINKQGGNKERHRGM